MIALLAAAAGLLAYANGANDNFKGVATLFGSRTTGYRRALRWATVMTAAGGLTALLLASGLARAFSGGELVPAELAASPAFLAAAGLGAAAAVLLATRLGLPVSTTHAILGGLLGAALAKAGTGGINSAVLGKSFVAPMLVSPLLASALTAPLYLVLARLRKRLGIAKTDCVCVTTGSGVAFIPAGPAAMATVAPGGLRVISGNREDCVERYTGVIAGVDAGRMLDAAHVASAGAVSFARGLNDTPKIAGLLLLVPALGGSGAGLALVAVLIALGGTLSARRVASTMSLDITRMNHGQGFLANAVSALLVLGASCFGLPVSTTHVTCGALFGLGAATGRARWPTIGTILLAWMTTLPLAAVLGGLAAALV